MYNHVVFLSHTSASRTRVSMNGIADQVEFASAVITKKKPKKPKKKKTISANFSRQEMSYFSFFHYSKFVSI